MRERIAAAVYYMCKSILNFQPECDKHPCIYPACIRDEELHSDVWSANITLSWPMGLFDYCWLYSTGERSPESGDAPIWSEDKTSSFLWQFKDSGGQYSSVFDVLGMNRVNFAPYMIYLTFKVSRELYRSSQVASLYRSSKQSKIAHFKTQLRSDAVFSWSL